MNDIEERDRQIEETLVKASEIVGHLLSQIEKRSDRYPVLYDIFIKLRGMSN